MDDCVTACNGPANADTQRMRRVMEGINFGVRKKQKIKGQMRTVELPVR